MTEALDGEEDGRKGWRGGGGCPGDVESMGVATPATSPALSFLLPRL